MSQIRITVTGFLNDDSLETSLGRLGLAALHNGISDAALRSLVRLTCQAHDVRVFGLDVHHFDEAHLAEMKQICLVHRPNPHDLKMA